MRYIRNKANLLDSLDRLKKFIDDNWIEDGRRNNPIRAFSEHLEDAMDKTQGEFDDIFGTEGYERNILGVD